MSDGVKSALRGRDGEPELVDADGEALPPEAKAALALITFALAACGGGGGGDSGSGSSIAPTPPAASVSETEAARFLTQATYGPTMDSIAELRALGYAAWMDRQFATPSLDRHYDYQVRGGPPGCVTCTSQFVNATMESFWLQAVEGPDQLRQRMVFALSEIFVVSDSSSALTGEQFGLAAFLDTLATHAFGNFRELLEAVTRSPAMGFYLSHYRNQKEDPTTGRIPDENYAREVMQLFTIGLWELNIDGSRRLDGAGQPIPTYDQMQISGMGRVFTGLSWGGADTSENRWNGFPINGVTTRVWNAPMQIYERYHSTSEKRIISNVVIPAGTTGDNTLRIALDTLFNHPNVGPFIGEQLIKRFVTSNPSRAYVQRVAQAFNNNGSGVRGDMRAVLRAILLDTEARDSANIARASWGKVREPMLRFSAWLRAFRARAANGRYNIWNLEDPANSLGQNPLRAPSVFNFFRPDYAPPGAVLAQGLTAPEFQITHDTTVTGYANFVTTTVERGYGFNESALRADYSAELALADRPDALLDRLNVLMLCGQLTTATRTLIRSAIESVAITANLGRERRVYIAVALLMMSSEFIVQK